MMCNLIFLPHYSLKLLSLPNLCHFFGLFMVCLLFFLLKPKRAVGEDVYLLGFDASPLYQQLFERFLKILRIYLRVSMYGSFPLPSSLHISNIWGWTRAKVGSTGVNASLPPWWQEINCLNKRRQREVTEFEGKVKNVTFHKSLLTDGSKGMMWWGPEQCCRKLFQQLGTLLVRRQLN